MKKYINIDDNGYLLGFSIIPNNNLIEISEEEFIEINQFTKPRKVDGVWIESQTDEDFKEEVPKMVNAIQFISQLSFEGITEAAITKVINTLPEPNKTVAKVSYQRAVYFERNNPFLDLVGKAFNKTDGELDQIFINASKI